MAYYNIQRRRGSKKAIFMTLVLLMTVLLSACNGDPQAQQNASLQKIHLDRSLAHARSIGVPGTVLQPIVKQERQISSTNAPFTLLSGQPVTDYYNNMAQSYQALTLRVSNLEKQVTAQYDYQAYRDIQTFETSIAERRSQNFIEVKTFMTQLAQDQALLARARTPNDYLQISSSARRSTQALQLMGPAYDKLQSLKQMTQQLQASNVDITALAQQESDDLAIFRNANKPEDFIYLINQLSAQIQQATVFSVQAIPYVGAYQGALKLQKFSAQIDEARRYGADVATFVLHLHNDQAALTSAKGDEYAGILSQIDNDLAAIQIPLIRAKTHYYLQQFKHEVQVWGNHHRYMDGYDGHAYNLDYEYDQQGIGSDLDASVQAAQTVDDYQSAITLINNSLLHLKTMEQDYTDRAPWDWPHGADFRLLKYYNLYGPGSGSVMVVSLVEQTMRFYQGGKLVRSFQVTTGQYARPTPPGLWNIFLREHPTEFKSSEPKGSAFWYPPTKIDYAMEYHDGGYFFHDSWWRADYGVGTNFPHYDSGGDEAFAGNGSHGCINMFPDDANWLYNHTGYGTAVIVY
ncbi:MAG: L,D-transpeptidase [Ktedonobacteraceae bacterium]